MKLKMRLLCLLLAVVMVVGLVPMIKAEANNTSPVDTDSIKVSLFDYGSDINYAQTPVPFNLGGSNSSIGPLDTDDKTDNTVNRVSFNYSPIKGGQMGMWPVLVNGFPSTAASSTQTGSSLKYLFNNTGSTTTQMPFEMLDAAGRTSYATKYYRVDESELIQYANGYYSFNSADNHVWYEYKDGKGILHRENYAVRPANVDYRYTAIGHFLPFNGPISKYEYDEATDATQRALDAYKNGFGNVSYLTRKETNGTSTMLGGTYNGNNDYFYVYKDGTLVDKASNNNFTFDTFGYGDTAYAPNDLNHRITKASTLYAIDNYQDVGDSNDNAEERVNMWIGMSVEFDFYQKHDGKTDQGNDVVFEFSGDDYMWVYIDDVMILDIALTGTASSHRNNSEGAPLGLAGGSKTATINFRTGEVIVYKVDSSKLDVNFDTNGRLVIDDNVTEHVAYYSTLRELFTAAKNNNYIDEIPEFEGDTLKDYTSHKLKMFYMDSGMGTSNCYLKFNMDLLPTGNVTLEKKVDGINPALSDNQSYGFTVTATDANHNAVNGMTYNIVSSTGAGSEQTVNSGGTIQLKANEKAVFSNINAGTTIAFLENFKPNTSATVWTLNGSNYTEGTETYIENEGQELNYVCTNTRITKDLSITKTFSGKQYEPDKAYEMNVSIADAVYTGKAMVGETEVDVINGKVSLKVGETVTIKNIPTGLTYSVNETAPTGENGFMYANPQYTNATGTINNDTTVTVSNSHVFANLTIDKNITDTLEDPDQAFLFRVTGGPDNIDMIVVVIGGSEKTIKHLPVGVGDDAIYTVTEITDKNWAWRYESDGEEEGITTLPDIAENATNTLEFKNKVRQGFWLSDETWFRNLFNGSTPNPALPETPIGPSVTD